jgi:hemerythrin
MPKDIGKRVAALQGLAVHSLKQIISWSHDFAIDQPTIDEQHERIFKLALEACDLSRDQANRPRLVASFNKFGTVLEAHFHYEERLLSDIGYPELDEHRAEHNANLSELDFIRQRLASQGEGWAFAQQALVVTNFMIGVTVGHILCSDVNYARYMQTTKEGESAELSGVSLER